VTDTLAELDAILEALVDVRGGLLAALNSIARYWAEVDSDVDELATSNT
jgi:hypothetical protein